jgi:hypothetical protein
VVVGGDEVPARLGAPRRLADRSVEGVEPPGDLGVGDERGLVRGEVGGERSGELVSVEEQEPVVGRKDGRHGGSGRRVGDEGVDRLSLVGCERGDVHERLDRGVLPVSVTTTPP